jgi:hypothetical protein
MAYNIGAKVTGKEWNDEHPGQAKNAADCFDGWHGMFERKPGITGAEALSRQHGRNKVTVRVCLPGSERTSDYHVEQLMICTPSVAFVTLSEISNAERGRAYTSISRRDAH